MRRICTAVCTLLVIHVTTASAQVVIVEEGHPTFNELATYLATVRTPVGGLPPIATSTMLGQVQTGVALSLRYGHAGETNGISSLNNFGATALLPMGTNSTLSLTGGLSAPSSGTTSLMLSIGGDTRLSSMPLSAGRGGSHLDFGLNGELGYGKPSEATLFAAEVGIPISLVPGAGPRDAMRIVPFLTPALTFANFDSDDPRVESQSAVHFMLGGGLALYNPTSPVAFNFGFQYMPWSGATTQFGFGLTLGGR
jgi:hypothetical protein